MDSEAGEGMISTNLDWLVRPAKLYPREDLFKDRDHPPSVPGVYGWFFDTLPDLVPTADCHRVEGGTLAYVGISPGKPKPGRSPSKQRLRKRLQTHFGNNAYGSTLRLTLGTLLADDLKIRLRRVGSGSRTTFADGEASLSRWMAEHARIVWTEHPAPWEVEEIAIESLSLPLNLKGNKAHPFHPRLTAMREAAKAKAALLPVVP